MRRSDIDFSGIVIVAADQTWLGASDVRRLMLGERLKSHVHKVQVLKTTRRRVDRKRGLPYAGAYVRFNMHKGRHTHQYYADRHWPYSKAELRPCCNMERSPTYGGGGPK